MPTELFGFAIVPLIVGLVEAAKRAGLSGKEAPLLSLILGLGAGFAVESQTPHAIYLRAGVYGIAYGLSASGIYSAVAKYASPDSPTDPKPANPKPPTDPTPPTPSKPAP